mmetsp:Transcript_46139/g.76858  ORF Transcript_46139/g.76858 Transcript_46139/m.76858 type:complete len:232 (+) Transcript_46139:2546-3241(+)
MYVALISDHLSGPSMRATAGKWKAQQRHRSASACWLLAMLRKCSRRQEGIGESVIVAMKGASCCSAAVLTHRDVSCMRTSIQPDNFLVRSVALTTSDRATILSAHDLRTAHDSSSHTSKNNGRRLLSLLSLPTISISLSIFAMAAFRTLLEASWQRLRSSGTANMLHRSAPNTGASSLSIFAAVARRSSSSSWAIIMTIRNSGDSRCSGDSIGPILMMASAAASRTCVASS